MQIIDFLCVGPIQIHFVDPDGTIHSKVLKRAQMLPFFANRPAMARRFGNDEMLRPFAAFTPARRIGTPEDVADAAVWLCSDERHAS